MVGLELLIKNSNIPSNMYEIIVISSDQPDSPKIDWIEKQEIDITLVLEDNRKTVRKQSLYYYENIGIKRAKYSWILVCNDDMWVECDWYEQFLTYITNTDKVYLVSSHIGSQGLGLRIPTIGTLTINGNEEPFWLYDMTIIHKMIYEKIGYLDESIGWYGKGADLGIAIGFLTDEKPIPCYNVKIHHDIEIEHRGDNISNQLLENHNSNDFEYIRSKWNKWIMENNNNNKYIWI